MKKNKIIIQLILFFCIGSSNSLDNSSMHPTIELTQARGTYILDFNKIYETVASLDIETAVTLPEGYRFILDRPGSIDFINAFVQQNTLFFTKTIDHPISTSIICNVSTPQGDIRQLVFKIRGSMTDPKVYAIHFIEYKTPDQEISMIRKAYERQVEIAIKKQKDGLKEEAYQETMKDARPVFFKTRKDNIFAENKGAQVLVDGIIYSKSKGTAFVYIKANVRDKNCDIIKLKNIKIGDNEFPCDIVDISKNDDETWMYIYKINMNQMPAKTVLEFVFEIWSEVIKIKAKIS